MFFGDEHRRSGIDRILGDREFDASCSESTSKTTIDSLAHEAPPLHVVGSVMVGRRGHHTVDDARQMIGTEKIEALPGLSTRRTSDRVRSTSGTCSSEFERSALSTDSSAYVRASRSSWATVGDPDAYSEERTVDKAIRRSMRRPTPLETSAFEGVSEGGKWSPMTFLTVSSASWRDRGLDRDGRG